MKGLKEVGLRSVDFGRHLDGATRWLLARGQPGNVDDGVRRVLDSRSLSNGNQSMENG